MLKKGVSMYQIDRQSFSFALKEAGHNPDYFHSLNLTPRDAASYFGMDFEFLAEAIKLGEVLKNSDGKISLLDAAWVHYCYQTEISILRCLEQMT
jgi:hypothetical protein